MTDLKLKLERLAQTGTQRSATDVVNSAIEEAMNRVSPAPLSPVVPDARRPRARKGGRVLTAGIAFLGVTSTTLIGIAAYGALNDNGGYESPTAAVDALARALQQKDPLAAVATIAPTELPGLDAAVRSAADKAAKIQLVKSASEPFAWLDVEFSKYELAVEYPDPAVAFVEVKGLRGAFGRNSSELGPLLRERGYTLGDEAEDINAKDEFSELTVVAVKRGDGWFVSPAYTTLEEIRRVNDLPAADFSIQAVSGSQLGAATPETAIEGAVRALVEHDPIAFASSIDSNEFPVWAYMPMFRELERRWDAGDRRTITSLSATVRTKDDDTAEVDLNGTYDLSDPQGALLEHYRITNSCAHLATVDGPMKVSESWLWSDVLFGGSPCFSADALDRDRFDAREVAKEPLIAVLRNGRWFASPTATFVHQIASYVSRFTDESVPPSGQTYSDVRSADRGDLVPDATLEVGVPLRIQSTNPENRGDRFDFRAPHVLALPGDTVPNELGCVAYRLSVSGDAVWDSTALNVAVRLAENRASDLSKPMTATVLFSDDPKAMLFEISEGDQPLVVIRDLDGNPLTVELERSGPVSPYNLTPCADR